MTVTPKSFWAGLATATVFCCLVFVAVFYPRDIAFEEKLAEAAERLTAVDYARRGLELYQEGKLRAAEKQYERAIAAAEELSQPRYAWHFRHATILHELGEDEAALDAIDRSLDAAVPMPGYLNTRGVILMALGDYESAEQSFTETIASDPEWWMAYVNRAAVKMHRNDLDGALRDLNAVIDAVGTPRRAPRALLRRGAILAMQGRLEDAEADFTAVIDAAGEILADPSKPLSAAIGWRESIVHALRNRATVRDALDKPIGARRDRERADAFAEELEALRAERGASKATA